MHLSIRRLVVAGTFIGAQAAFAPFAFSQAAQTAASGMSARELFYLDDTASASPKAKASTPQKINRVKTSTQTAQAVEKHEVNTAGNVASQQTVPTRGGEGSGAQVRLASDRTYPPLGMRYAVYRVANGSKEPVDADTVFHSNDHIQFSVDVNTPAYLYVISRGSSGRWSTLFPTADAAADSNLIQPHAGYTFPPGQVITFAEPAGKEELFLFLSRQPVRSTEDLMLQISKNGKATPASQPADQFQHSNVVEAFNRMDDSQINDLRNAYSRDLIVEKVDTQSAAAPAPPVAQAPAKDTSVYVVNPSTAPETHVVADVTFRHE